ncbi:MAG: hypothetical protein JXK95_10920 [Bacteroidales bacterium]|nr:hypothetical protein [Bacteroidales bacterium]
MKNFLSIMAMLAILMVACTGKAKEQKAAEAEAVEIERIDSVTAEMDSIRNMIESSAKEVDELINDL